MNNPTCPGDPGSNYTTWYKYDEATSTNSKGRRTSMWDGSGSTVWNFDLQGRVTTRTDAITGGGTYATSWTYDAMNRLRTMTYPDGEQVATTYNAQGLPATLGTYITASSYNAASQLTSLTFFNNAVTTYGYNQQNLRLTSLTTSGNLQNLSYLYDNVGNVTRITDAVRNETQNFAYDDLDRLTSVTGAYSQGWTYNAIGNILTHTGVDAATFTYGNDAHKHAVTQVGTTAYTYDANGNMTARGSDSLLYDQENRLYRVTVGGTQTDYTYNADSARVKKVVGSTTTYYVGNWYEVTNGIATKYYYFGAQRVAMKQGTTLTYLHGDHLGSTSVASNASGGLVSRQTYYAFGGVRTTEGTLPTDYTFTGQKNDTSSALMFYNARYYDANIGRFVQADPIVAAPFNPQSLNRFAYVLNNPVKYTDPTGHCAIDPVTDACERDEHGGVILYERFRFDYTVEEFMRMSFDERANWLKQFARKVGATGWFDNIDDQLKFFGELGKMYDPATGRWFSAGDAIVLQAIQNGWELFRGNTPKQFPSDIAKVAAELWKEFFTVIQDPNFSKSKALEVWGKAESAGVLAGKEYADKTAGRPDGPGGYLIANYVSAGNVYRELVTRGLFDPRENKGFTYVLAHLVQGWSLATWLQSVDPYSTSLQWVY